MRPDYVLPLRWVDADDPDGSALAELAGYLRRISDHARVIVVDGSSPQRFTAHGRTFGATVRHVRPDSRPGGNGKVAGVDTGLRLATSETVVIADDDVRYDAESLAAVVAGLDGADLVGPQNVFRPLPWHARWDTARSLLNRAFGADYPGTFAVRRSTFLAMGGYDGDVMFENLELIRTVRAAGGTVRRPREVFVVRRPPSARRFWSQRVRQAYDDLAQPLRLVPTLAVAPAVVTALVRRKPGVVLLGAAGVVGWAEVGRRRGGGRAMFPASTVLFAPLWLAERAVCVWVAVGLRWLRGGVPYGGSRLRVAAHSERSLRRRLAARAGQPDSSEPVSADPAVRRASPAGARNPAAWWEPSQNGLRADRPHRHSATVLRPASIGVPSGATIRTGPRTRSGPSR